MADCKHCQHYAGEYIIKHGEFAPETPESKKPYYLCCHCGMYCKEFSLTWTAEKPEGAL